ELDKPVLYVRENSAGRWNLQEVGELLGRTLGKKTGDQTAQTSATAALPTISIKEMTIVVLDNKNRTVRIEPINVDGSPETPVSWKYDLEIPSGQANVPPHLSVVGRVAPGGFWAHEATVWVNDIGGWVRPWAPSFNQKVTFHGTWAAQFTSDGLGGYLQILDSGLGAYHAKGALSVVRAGSNTSLRPENLNLRVQDDSDPSKPQTKMAVTVPRGAIDYDGRVIKATQVQLALMGGPATFNGWFEPDINQGALEAYWQNLVISKAGVTQSGKLNVTYSKPVAAPIRVEAVISSAGVAQNYPFDAVAKANLSGQTFGDLTWQVTLPQLAWYRPPEPVILNGLSIAGAYQQDSQHKVVRLEKLSLPADNRLAGSGSYDLTSKEGQIHAEGQDWPVKLVEGTRLAFVIDAAGRGVPSIANPKKTVAAIDLHQLTLRSGDATLSLNGSYDARLPKPVTANVTFTNSPGTANRVGAASMIHGWIQGNANLVGTLSPCQIGVTGSLGARDASILGHPIGEISSKLAGVIDGQKAEVHANGIPFLDGIWNLGATYVRERDGKPVYATTVEASVDNLPLPKVTDFVKSQKVDGTFAGHWFVYFPGLKPTATNIALTGSGSVKNFAASYLKADEVNFNTTLQNGVFKVDPIRLTRGNYARIDSHAQVALNNWRRVTAGLSITGYPVDLPSAGVGLQLFGGAVQSGEANVDPITIYLPDPKAKDPAARLLRVNTELNVRTVISIESQADAQGRRTMQPEGEIRVAAGMNGRLLDLRSVRGNVLGGTITADGVSDLTDLDHMLTRTKLNFAWDGLQTQPIVQLYPGLKGTEGALSGHGRAQPAAMPRPLEPLQLDVFSNAKDLRWKQVRLAGAELHAFLGAQRFIASDLQPSFMNLANGRLRFWFTSSGHNDTQTLPNGADVKTGVTISNQLNLMLDQISIDPFVASFDPGHQPGFGKMDGQVFLLSAPKTKTLAAAASTLSEASTRPAAASQPAQQETTLQHLMATTTADGNIRLLNSDLGNFGPIAFLYNLMHLGGDIRNPTGHGTVSFRLEAGSLHVSNLYFFNRGVEVRGVATVNQIWKLQDAPIGGSAVGNASPLKNVKIPLLAEASAVLAGLQKQLIGVEFKGIVRDPKKEYIRPLGLTQLGSELRGILLGELGANRTE
ncbi:MAG TPA: hypothetical protein VLJ39_22155, partial [Tepidisphaeraceae bacterium]|nr:hypothetical protein [Tepidisphaeraceae bacterium]